MASSYAFAFPKPHHNAFRLLVGSTVGYLSDAIFYRLDLHSGKAEALQYHIPYPVTQTAGPTKPSLPFTSEESLSLPTMAKVPTSTSTLPMPRGTSRYAMSVPWRS